MYHDKEIIIDVIPEEVISNPIIPIYIAKLIVYLLTTILILWIFSL